MMRINRHTRGWLWVVVLSAMMTAYSNVIHSAGHGPQAAKPGAVSEQALSNKLQLLDRLVHGEGLINRVSNSDDAEAKQLLSEAQALWEQAEIKFEVGNYKAADDYARQGLSTISTVSRKVVDTGREAAAGRARYDQLRKRVLDFTEAFQRVVAEKPGESIGPLLDQQAVSRLLLEAEEQMQEKNFTIANQRMVEAADIVEFALVRARDKDTLLHELKFDSPEDEYRYEQQRNNSYKLLVDMLEKEKTGNSSGLAQMREAVKENARICGMADKLVEQGDIEAGIRTLEEGTEKLARVLRMSGLVF